MKTVNFKFITTSVLLFGAFFSQTLFSGNPIRNDDPSQPGGSNSPLATSLQVESISPITYDILGSNLAVCFNSKIGIATVSVEDQYGNVVYQSVVNTDTQSVLYIPVQDMESGSYILKVTSSSTNFIGAFQL